MDELCCGIPGPGHWTEKKEMGKASGLPIPELTSTHTHMCTLTPHGTAPTAITITWNLTYFLSPVPLSHRSTSALSSAPVSWPLPALSASHQPAAPHTHSVLKYLDSLEAGCSPWLGGCCCSDPSALRPKCCCPDL